MKQRASLSQAGDAAVEPLGVYRAKRDFSRTPEPAEGGERAAADPTYVIHKHWASHLHYDLRLEIDGVMVSWAVPKGPSYDPKDKRMAVHVEDHPISYSSFEGTIPKGQYGGGKVIVWDKGHWRPLGDAAEGLRAGQLKLELLGHKLKGKWTLVRMKGKGEKHEPWLFIKEKDALAKPAAEFSVIDELPDSVGALGMPGAHRKAAPATALVASAGKLGPEGVTGKRRDSPDRSGQSAQGIELKCGRRQEFVVGGYTAPRGQRSGFGSLMLGVYSAEGVLQYAGNVGSGFDELELTDIKRRLDKLAASKSPFVEHVAPPGAPHWVRPTLVVEASFAEWTRDGRVRHAVFRGLRSDKPVTEIRREEPREVDMAEPGSAPARRAPKLADSKTSGPSSTLKVSHGDRVIDATSGLTKIDLVRYYDLVGALMKPHVAGRPTSVVRAPDGVEGELFFQKHMDTQKMPGLSASPCEGSAPGIEVATPAGLLSLAHWNVVELHTSNMRAAHCGKPDRMVFDLDPGESVSWQQVQEAAELVRGFLEQIGLPAFLKTSGGKGLHLVVPIKPMVEFEPVKAFAHAIVTHIAQTIPQRFVAVSGPKNRVRKIFIDYLRNGEAATTACAWSARARPGMGISVPVGWNELMQLRGGDHWTVRSVHERLGHGNEPWRGYARAARSLRAPMKMLGFAPAANKK